jgi:CheY-like chemotaxis protein
MATILLCEDDPTIQKLVVAALRSTTHSVLVAGNGAEGLALAESKRPDLIVTDLAMPGLDGYQLLEAVRHRSGSNHIPVILLTASAQRADLEEAHRRGFAEVLVKPFSPANLRSIVEQVLHASQQPV